MMEEIIAAVFAEMSALYGKKFADQWSGVDPETLKYVWSDKLSRYANRPEVIRKALNKCDNLPWPPTLPEFIGLCSESSIEIAQSQAGGIWPPPRVLADTRTDEEKEAHNKRQAELIDSLLQKMKMKQ